MTGVSYMWCGAPTTTTLRPAFVLDGPAASVRGAFSRKPNMAPPLTYTAAVTPDAQHACQPGDATGLYPNTRYYYAAEVDGVLDRANVARAKTMPTLGRPLALTFGSCWAAPSQGSAHLPDHPVGNAIVAQHDAGANLHIFAGDFGYPNINTNDPARYRANYAEMCGIPAVAAIARSCAWDLVWDDHDFGPDNSNRTAPGRASAAAVYRQVVPQFDLPDSAGAIYHAYNMTPDVRVITTDLRYYRSPDSDPDDASKTMLGAEQKAWLKEEWLAAKNAGQLIVWVNTQIWCIDGPYATQGLNADGDHWGTFSTERAELDNYRAANGITDMVILTGDAHQICYRTGTDYSTAKTVPTPVFAAAAYSRTPAYRSGAWEACSPPAEGDGHYGVLRIARGESGGHLVDCDFHLVDPATGADTIEFSAPQQRFGMATAGLYSIGGQGANVGGGPQLVRVS